jgi:hypothetical protein
VDRDSRQLLIDRLDLLGVQADSGLDAQAADRIAQAELIARAGPAKAANKPSPVVATSQPPNRSSSARRIRYHAAPVGEQLTLASRTRESWYPACGSPLGGGCLPGSLLCRHRRGELVALLVVVEAGPAVPGGP